MSGPLGNHLVLSSSNSSRETSGLSENDLMSNLLFTVHQHDEMLGEHEKIL